MPSFVADKSVLCVANERVYPEHDWSRPYDGWIMGEVGKQTMETWKVACLRCGHIEQREAPFTGKELDS